MHHSILRYAIICDGTLPYTTMYTKSKDPGLKLEPCRPQGGLQSRSSPGKLRDTSPAPRLHRVLGLGLRVGDLGVTHTVFMGLGF